jgi:antitoxin component of MazEF toxin-antitoxin module
LYIRGDGDADQDPEVGQQPRVTNPRSFAAEAKVAEGSTVELSVAGGSLHVRPLRARKYVLSTLLKKVKSQNLHGEVSTGEAAGREVW